MSAKIWIAGVGLAVAGAGLTVAWRSWSGTRAAEAERGRLDEQRASNEAGIRRLEAARVVAEKDRENFEAQRQAMKAKTKLAASGQRPASTGRQSGSSPNYANPADVMMRDPKLQAMSMAAQRARFETTYGPFARLQRLTPEQLAKMAAAQAHFDEMQQDTMMVIREQKLSPDDPAVATLRRQAAEELRASQLEVLGSEGYEQLQNYERTLPVRTIAQRFAAAMTVADQPMTMDQANQLTQIMAEAGRSAGERGRVNPSEIDWALVDQRAGSVLSPRQLTLFKSIEPIGGGASRWGAQLERTVEEARKSLAQSKSGKSG